MRCVNCTGDIKIPKFAVRDFKKTETRFQWWLRHVIGLLTMNWWDRRNLATILPVCEECVEKFKDTDFIVNRDDEQQTD